MDQVHVVRHKVLVEGRSQRHVAYQLDGTVGIDAGRFGQPTFGPMLLVPWRFSLGPELVFMIGPGFDRDLFVTGSVWFDVARFRVDRHVTHSRLSVSLGYRRNR